ncbi:Glycosyltransferase involved in cell wall bisynthesis [Arthrobacter sp. UNCCL28]|uniref:glycosyltransferase family 4 protein n=1 Tax=Micrococcaceae TaxID=1268 RepID=UPI000876FC2B|nr:MULTISPECIES: glycosyltransferase family 1 protein [Micrococcaceae]SCZ49441.1 Glycosyltransferase involved in cell wall bisynthesis [Arthrobacter sp. UNCCL28]
MNRLKQVSFPSRILSRHVGGNTTYAREIAKGLELRGVEISQLRSSKRAALTALMETWQGLTVPAKPGLVLHYSADTGPLLPTRAPSVVTVHGVASRWITTARSAQQERIWRTRVQRAIRSTDAVITVSQSSADDVAQVFGMDPALITTIPHGIDTDYFARPRALGERLQHLRSTPYVLYLGNIEPRKNLIELVRAFALPGLKDLGVKLVIAGKPAWNATETMAAIESAGIEYLGFVDDDERVALMQHAALFAFPSLYEGFGFPVLEALASGTPVICSDRGSLQEVAGPSLLFEDTDAESIARGIEGALGSSAATEQVREAGLAWARRFSWDASVEAHTAVYEKVLQR